MEKFKEQIAEIAQILCENSRQSKIKNFRELAKIALKNQIVFIGDSITDNFPLDEIFPDVLIYNRGIVGDETKHVLERLEDSVYNLLPHKVFLCIGTNDLETGVSHDTIVENTFEIVSDIRETLSDCKIFLISLFPVTDAVKNANGLPGKGSRENADIEKINERLSKINEAMFIDVAKYFKDENGEMKPEYTTDGLHLNIEGYILYRKAIKEAVYDR